MRQPRRKGLKAVLPVEDIGSFASLLNAFWGGVVSPTVVLVLLVTLSFRDRQRLRSEIQRRLQEASGTSEPE